MVDENNKRIVKNVIAIYLRMFISMIVSLYMSRIVLQVLGASDYGIYVLVGGVVVMFSFLNSAIGGATSRFINYAMGLKDNLYLENTFRTALLTHLIIALSVLILCETIGVWMIANKLVIPEDRLFSAHIVLQFSILSMCIGILQGPFSACIIAHEKMNVYAYVEILVVCLKLVIVYALLILNFDKLVLYSLFVCIISIISITIYIYYSKKKFAEVSFVPLFKKDMFYPMLSFSGWRFFGSLTDTFSSQGRNMILNLFYGTILNAAAGLASTIHGVIGSFAYNVMVPFRPQIIICYAENNYSRMQFLIEKSFAISNILFFFIGLPVFFECDFLLSLWLVDVPDYTVPFVRITLVISLILNNYGFEGTIIGASGNIKISQLCIGVINILSLIISYLFFMHGCDPTSIYYIAISCYLFIFFINFILIKKYIPRLSLKSLFINGFLKDIIILTCCVIVLSMICNFMDPGLLRMIVILVSNTVIVCLGSYFLILTDSMRKILVVRIKNILYK